MCRASSTILQ